MNTTIYGSTRRWRRRALIAPMCGLALACNPDRVLTVKDVDVLSPSALNSKAALPALVAGSAAEFQLAFSGAADLNNGGHEGILNLGGLLADEYIHAETFPDRQSVDQRKVDAGNGSMQGVFDDLARARAFADLAADRFNKFDQGGEGHADVLNFAAYTYLLFAENFCSGVPFSTLTDAGVLYGEPQTRDQMLAIALAKFDSAIAFAGTSNVTQQRLGRVGKARTQLNQSRFADAAATVAGIPTGFRYVVESSSNTTRQNNGIWMYTVNFFGFSVADREGTNGLPFVSADDPRVPVIDIEDVGFDGETPYFLQQKYPSLTSDVELASGTEARLIEAEAALQIGNPGSFMGIVNNLRSNAGMQTLSDPQTARGREDLLFAERGYWTYLTGHRLGDLRRRVRQYNRAINEVFPSGAYHKGGEYGSDVNFPVSANERNNPRFTACLDRNP